MVDQYNERTTCVLKNKGSLLHLDVRFLHIYKNSVLAQKIVNEIFAYIYFFLMKFLKFRLKFLFSGMFYDLSLMGKTKSIWRNRVWNEFIQFRLQLIEKILENFLKKQKSFTVYPKVAWIFIRLFKHFLLILNLFRAR